MISLIGNSRTMPYSCHNTIVPIVVGRMTKPRGSSILTLPPTTCTSPTGRTGGWKGSVLKNVLLIKFRTDRESASIHTVTVCTVPETKKGLRRGVPNEFSARHATSGPVLRVPTSAITNITASVSGTRESLVLLRIALAPLAAEMLDCDSENFLPNCLSAFHFGHYRK